MPEEEGVKQQLLNEVEPDLPEGIRDFLTTPLPAGPTLTAPSTVDNAIICQAEFCVWLGELFGAFEGVTPVSIPMYIGQFNTVMQGLLLSSLEYRTETQIAKDFEITDPVDGTEYGPGELRISAKAKNDTTIRHMACAFDGNDFDLIEREGTWRQFVDVQDFGDYTLTVTATFADETTASQSVSFAVIDPEAVPDEEEPPEPPGGVDEEAVAQAESKIEEALDALADQSVLDVPGYAQRWIDVIRTQYGILGNIGEQVLDGDLRGAANTAVTEVLGVLSAYENNIANYDPEGDPLALGNLLGRIRDADTSLLGLLRTGLEGLDEWL